MLDWHGGTPAPITESHRGKGVDGGKEEGRGGGLGWEEGSKMLVLMKK